MAHCTSVGLQRTWDWEGSHFVKRRSCSSGRSSSYSLETLEGRRLLAAVVASTPYNGQVAVGVSSNLLVTFGSAMNSSTLTSSRITLKNAAGATLASALSYNSSSRVLTINPNANLSTTAGYYTLRITGGSNGVKGTDGTGLENDYLMSFTSGSAGALTQQTAWSGLSKPTNIEFAADGRVYIAEQSGVIKLFDNLSDTTPTTVADFRTNVHNFWDRGLLGMALHPQFSSGQPYIYVLYTYDGAINGPSPTWGTVDGLNDGGGSSPTGTGAAVSGRLSRFMVKAAGVMTGSEQVLINDWNNQFPSHSIGDLKFGPDGMLYASAGDGASFNNVDYGQYGNPFNDPTNEGGALRSQDILSDGDAAGLDGTIIRIDPVTGAAAPGNPFAGSSDANKRRVIANGLRNPFRITFKPGTKELFIAETGWNTYEEINRIPDATDATAENFGWPAYEGPNRQTGYDAANLPLLENFYNNPSAHSSPWFSYAHSAQVVPGSGEPTGGSTPTGVAFYQAGNYPVAYNGALFFADYARNRIYIMYAGPDGQMNQASRQVVATGGAVELTAGPNGDIYAVNLTAGTVTRFVAAAGSNLAPTARIVADRTNGGAPLTVAFNGTTSTDPENGTLAYAWDLDGDGAFDDSTAASPTYTYATTGTFTVRLRVTDAGGLTNIATQTITTSNRAPVPTITSPLTSLRWRVGETISFAGSATDPDEGTLAASKLTWELVLMHANEIDPTNVHEHRITGFNGVANGSFIAPDHEYPSWLELRLTATDSSGLSASTSMRVDPRTVVLTFQTNPIGLQLTHNSDTFTGTKQKTVIAGSANTINASITQVLNGVSYAFSGWSNGGQPFQSLTAPDSNTTYIATYSAIGGPTLPAAPTGFRAVVLPGAQVKLDWTDASNNETSFVIQRRYTNWVWEDLPFSAGANATTITDTTAYSGVSYEYRVAARNAVGQSAWSDGFIVDTGVIGAQPPAAPSSLTATAISGTRVDLAWQDNSGNETGFRIERRVAGGTFALLATAAANARTYSDTTAAIGTAYEYRVIATDGTLNSVASNTALVTTPGGTGAVPTAASNLVLSLLSNGSVSLSWRDNSTNETSFLIQRRYTNWIWGDVATVGANATSFVDSTAVRNATHEYRVIALNAAGKSEDSNYVTIFIPSA